MGDLEGPIGKLGDREVIGPSRLKRRESGGLPPPLADIDSMRD